MTGGLFRVILYIAILLIPVIGATFMGEKEGFLESVSLNLALMGFMILTLQFLIASRIRWIERAFGLDILIRYHKYTAVTAVCFLIAHPILLAIDENSWNLLIGLNLSWYIWAGKTALLLVIINILFSIFQEKIGMTFEKWRLGHDILAPSILILIFIHPLKAGEDFELLPMRILWFVMLILALSMLVYHRFIRPFRLRRHAYLVEEVVKETEDVWTIKLVPPEGGKIPDYLPGQFHFLTFFRKPGLPVEEHHWTISSSPSQRGYISSTIKSLGDFTSTIGQTGKGDTASVHGSFGRFSYSLHPDERDLVFIAGGIGITPLMAMLRHMRDTGDDRQVLLLYGNKNEKGIVFRNELDDIASSGKPPLNIVHVLSEPDGTWTGESGFIDREKVEKYCGKNLDGKIFYVCGPKVMAEQIIASLRGMGVSDKQIRQEIFSFLD